MRIGPAAAVLLLALLGALLGASCTDGERQAARTALEVNSLACQAASIAGVGTPATSLECLAVRPALGLLEASASASAAPSGS